MKPSLTLNHLDSARVSKIAWWASAALGMLLVAMSMIRARMYFIGLTAGTRLTYKDFATLRERMMHGVVFIALFGIYGAWVWLKLRGRRADQETESPDTLPAIIDPQSPIKNLLTYALPLMALAWLVYPYSGDVRLYLHYGAMANAGVNPFTTRADQFTSIWSPSLAWGQTSTYGPIAVGLFSLVARLSPTHTLTGWTQTLASLYVLKLITLAFHMATTVLIAKVMSPRKDRWDWAFLYGVNPVVLQEIVANAHIDAALILLTVATLLAVRHNRYVTAAGVLVAAAMVKTVAVIWLPLLGLDMLRARRYRAAAAAIGGGLALAALLASTLLTTPHAWSSLLNSGTGEKVSQSISSVVWRLLMDPVGMEDPRLHTVVITLVLSLKAIFVLLSAFIAWRLWSRREWTVAGAIAVATLLLFVLACPWYRPWYATVLLIPPLFVSLGFWNRVAVIALVLGGSIGTALFPPNLSLDLISAVPVVICLLISFAVEVRSTIRSSAIGFEPIAPLSSEPA